MNLLFPPKCILCGVIIDAQREDSCPECRRSLPWAGTAVKQGGYHEGVISAFRYEGSVREAFLRYKFQGQYWLADVFGQLLAQTVAAQLEGRFDLITWAPVSKKRKRQRTYDQAELLAKSAGLALDAPAAQCLIKTRHTKPNSSLDDLKEKQRNVEGVYEALPGMGGRRILLIDDVCTTGSTLSECAKTLMLGGAKSVICATFARTGD
ncbi:MAG: ComF family protein [Clostridiales bacterium]|nr:ComF family protein [Clostridiales bacterium]